eukprot:jgi/Mesvir1/11285/Mv01079-RA.1
MGYRALFLLLLVSFSIGTLGGAHVEGEAVTDGVIEREDGELRSSESTSAIADKSPADEPEAAPAEQGEPSAGNEEEEVTQEVPIQSTEWWDLSDANVEELVAMADGGSRDAQYLLGVMRLVGKRAGDDVGIPKDTAAAYRLLSAAADQGHPQAQSALAFMFRHGVGGAPQDEARAALYHAFAARGGAVASQLALAYYYWTRSKVHEGRCADALSLYSQVAERAMASYEVPGRAPLVEAVHLMHSWGATGGQHDAEAVRGHQGEADETIQYVQYMAEQGNVGSLRTMGSLHYWGARGLPRDHGQAYLYLRRAADAGDPEAMVSVGDMHATGVGVARNESEAMAWFQRAVDAGHVGAHGGLGYLLAYGRTTPHDYGKAVEHFTTAVAGAGDVDAQYHLGVMHMKGTGVARDYNKAAQLLTLAAARQHPGALYHLAKLYHLGTGLSMSCRSAVILYKQVAERGPWGALLRAGHERFLVGDMPAAFLLYARAAEMGYEVGASNAAWLLETSHGEGHSAHKASQGDPSHEGETPQHWQGSEEADLGLHRRRGKPMARVSMEEGGYASWRAAVLLWMWEQGAEQGNVYALMRVGDHFYYGKGGRAVDIPRAAAAYQAAAALGNVQAMYNLGSMHERGEGLPRDLHLAKRYYEQAIATNGDALLPCTLALASLRARMWLESSPTAQWLLATLQRFLPSFGGPVEEGAGAQGVGSTLTVQGKGGVSGKGVSATSGSKRGQKELGGDSGTGAPGSKRSSGVRESVGEGAPLLGMDDDEWETFVLAVLVGALGVVLYLRRRRQQSSRHAAVPARPTAVH